MLQHSQKSDGNIFGISLKIQSTRRDFLASVFKEEEIVISEQILLNCDLMEVIINCQYLEL